MSVGIICEYNPFHNGHLYHLTEIKNKFPNCTIILVMSGNFTQRGIPSILNKWDKTSIALEYGIDLVIELPFFFTCQSADIFAKASIQILKYLNVDYLVFGSESNDIDKIKSLAYTQLYNENYDTLVNSYLSENISYPKALSKALKKLTNLEIKEPNDILGLAYTKEIIKQNANIIPITIKRKNNHNSNKIAGKITSSSSIRKAMVEKKDIQLYVPKLCYKYLKNEHNLIKDYFNLLKYKILLENDLKIFLEVNSEFENRAKKYILECQTLEEFIKKLKTKHFTYNKVNRILVHIFCNIEKNDKKEITDIEYIRVLGFNDKGKLYLKKQKKQIKIPIITHITEKGCMLEKIEIKATKAYANMLNSYDLKKIIEAEWKNKPIIK